MMVAISKFFYCFEPSRLSSSHQRSIFPRSSIPSLWRWIFIIIIAFCLFLTSVDANIRNSHDVIEGIVGDVAKLRCKVARFLKNESPVLVLWYKDGARMPFFTLDLREDGPEHFLVDEMRFRVNGDDTGEFLTLGSLVASDSAFYKCKVDYDNAPSLEATVRLIVYDPPNKILIQDESRRIYSGPILGPINEGSKLSVYCIAIGGNPTSKISWWVGSKLLSDSSLNLSSLEDSYFPSKGRVSSIFSRTISGTTDIASHIDVRAPRVVSQLNILPIKRRHSGINITCQANNNNISEPLLKTLTLSVYLRPESVEIIVLKKPLQENISARLKCETLGSYPPAKVTWELTKNDKHRTLESKQSNVKNGKTISWLTIAFQAKDHGSVLTCRANNPSLPGEGTQNSTVLDIHFAPRVNMQLGKNLNHLSIKEGEDVYFECEISCNPRETAISWHKDMIPVVQDLKAGILLSQENLVLQRINRSYAGNYTCSAKNKLGTTTSNVVELLVMYLPVCSTNPTTVAVAEEVQVKLECRVDSRPSKNLKFIWLFNNTLDTVEVGTDRIKVEGPLSYIDYTPLSSRDYGTLLCWAANEVGMQADPCQFTVIETGPPERVKNCILVNHTVDNLEVRCSPGSNGGTSQRFVAKVFSATTHKLVEELKRKVPRFQVTGLTPGQDYLVTVTAINDKGSSEPEQIDAFRLKVAEKRMGDVKSPSVSPLVGVFLGLVGGFLSLLLVGLFLSRARAQRSNCWSRKRAVDSISTQKYSESPIDQSHQKIAKHLHSQIASSPISKTPLHEDDEDSPDLVKSSTETSHLINSRKCPDMITRRPIYIPSPDSVSSPMNGATCIGSGSLAPFLVSQSPIHLPSDESFV